MFESVKLWAQAKFYTTVEKFGSKCSSLLTTGWSVRVSCAEDPGGPQLAVGASDHAGGHVAILLPVVVVAAAL